MIPTLMNDFEGFKTSMEEVTSDMVEIARDLKLEGEPEDMTDMLQSHDKTLTLKSYFVWMSKESSFLRWNLLL